MSVRTIRLFHDIHMGLSHEGLARLADEAGIKVAGLDAGEILMFINKKRDKLKILGHHGIIIGYLRMPGGNRIDMGAIQYIPQTFGSRGEINYPLALRKSLEQRLRQ